MNKRVLDINGLIVPLVTPMNKDLSFDKIGMKTHVSRLMNQGVRNFMPLGYTGEYSSISLGDFREVVRVVSDTVGSKGSVLCGCIGSSTEEIIDKVNLADRNGADACFVNVPLTALTNEVFFMDYFEELFSQTKTNLLLYNNPSVFKRNIPILGIEKIANWECLYGIKDSSGNYEYFKELCNFKQTLKIFQGDERLAFDSLRLNCAGLVSGTSNVMPTLFLDIINQFRKLNLQGMVRQQHGIKSLLEEFFPVDKRIQRYKYVLSVQGIIQEYHSEELENLSEKEKGLLDEFVKMSLA